MDTIVDLSAPDKRDELTVIYLEIDATEYLLVAVIRGSNVIESDMANCYWNVTRGFVWLVATLELLNERLGSNEVGQVIFKVVKLPV